jgi:RES domain-containing protein
MIYAAGSLSLAAMEMLVHLDSSELLGRYVSIPVRFDSSLCRRLPTARIPPDWRDDPAPISTRRLGSVWARNGTSAILAVPSVLVPLETNYLINLQHPDFRKLEIGKVVSFQFDPRLVKRS